MFICKNFQGQILFRDRNNLEIIVNSSLIHKKNEITDKIYFKNYHFKYINKMLEYTKIEKSAINNSKSKQLYTFPKTSRFKQKIQIATHQIYNLPSLLEKRGPCFGHSKKQMKFPHQQQKKYIPSPNTYQFQTDIETNKKKKIGISIAEKITGQYLIKRLNKTPGPGAYSPSQSSKRSLTLPFNKQRKKFQYPLALRKGLESPGPAAHSQTSIKKLGVSLESKYKNIPNSVIGMEQKTSKKINKDVPAPNSYQPQKLLISYIKNRFKNNKETLNFSSYSARKYKPIEDLPGPANYFQFSQFAAKNKPYNINMMKDKKVKQYKLSKTYKSLQLLKTMKNQKSIPQKSSPVNKTQVNVEQQTKMQNKV